MFDLGLLARPAAQGGLGGAVAYSQVAPGMGASSYVQRLLPTTTCACTT